ncbi:hypothetical protein RFI_06999 [Reticulomyxa filosa]|uniref:Sulfotransferase domain-containing protein n=1 Tax=Reticulomyxa filosa TaxID=46433 RepID=X6NW64_RETFI|nr:hypothetical protein RFI_06999 [Reticulomyxa filosa]|eukprot:ETO30123.1 hypothetical protein RFI_06999 [Reticulomyxa filosa]
MAVLTWASRTRILLLLIGMIVLYWVTVVDVWEERTREVQLYDNKYENEYEKKWTAWIKEANEKSRIEKEEEKRARCEKIRNDTKLIKWEEKMKDNGRFKKKVTPYLLSFAGSGNSITRLLLEYIYGYYTGSIYTNDKILKKQGKFEGEGLVNSSVLIIKMHPIHCLTIWDKIIYGKYVPYRHKESGKIIFDSISIIENADTNISLYDIPYYKYIYNDVPSLNRISAIVLIRNPWDSMFSAYQLIAHELQEKDRHPNFRYKSYGAGHTEWISLEWYNSNITLFKQRFEEILENRIIRHQLLFYRSIKQLYDMYGTDKDRFMFVKFEHLFDPKFQLKIFFDISTFLFTESHLSIYHSKAFVLHTFHTFQCIQLFHDQDIRLKAIHRTMYNNTDNTSVFITKHFAYNLFSPDVICKWWDSLKPHTQAFGYTVWNPEINKCD